MHIFPLPQKLGDDKNIEQDLHSETKYSGFIWNNDQTILYI